MLAVRSCLSFRYTNFCAPLKLSISSSVSHSKFILLKLHLSVSPKPRAMSTRPSAFDALMSNARMAAKKKLPSQSQNAPSPSKRKAADSPQPKSENPSDSSTQVTHLQSPEKAIESNENSEEIDTKSVAAEKPESHVTTKSRNSDSKKARTMAAVNVDDKIGQLKKKAADFDPKSAAWWEGAERVPFLFIARAFDLISKETGRIVITDIVCNVLRTVIATTPDDLLAVVYLLANKIAPAHEGLELGIGDASIIKALAEACGGKEAHIKSQYKELGDLGLVAKAIRSSQTMMHQPAPLTVAHVFDTFRLIAKASGKDSQEKKKNYMKLLLVAAKDCEPLFLIRLLQTKLRVGLAEQTLLVALGQAAVYAEKHSTPPSNIQSPLEEAAKIVKQVYSVLPVYDKIILALLSDGVWNLPKTCTFSPGVPIGPMLAKPTRGYQTF
ncbi:hypothetical protein Nepgr_000619 [Nepenthes gracilis]|uniref:DNA ligase ATP-dependent N-terminal domain-containing protein n=1 Tax=Nepenthes gracilis TaxID=150966 RepID=A0AAD3P4R6_NEPGR|nr:hypothetical protein Nepgr_000619 [Nepenthes gracilis]